MYKIVENAFVTDVPPLSEIGKKKLQLFCIRNTHHSILSARSYVPNVVEIGGIHIKPMKALTEHMKKFFDGASERVLLFRWRSMTNASTFPEQI